MTVSPQVIEATVNAYYPQALAEASAARARAQNGYAIAAAIAGALVAAGLLGGLGRQPLAIQLVGCSAIAVWLACALLFLRAVATSAPALAAGAGAASAEDFVKDIMRATKDERAAVERWTRWAVGTAVVAVVVTFAAVVLGLSQDDDDQLLDVADGRVLLTVSGQSAVRAACGTGATSVAAQVDEHDLDAPTVRLTILDRCHARGRSTLLLPRSAIAGFVEQPSR